MRYELVLRYSTYWLTCTKFVSNSPHKFVKGHQGTLNSILLQASCAYFLVCYRKSIDYTWGRKHQFVTQKKCNQHPYKHLHTFLESYFCCYTTFSLTVDSTKHLHNNQDILHLKIIQAKLSMQIQCSKIIIKQALTSDVVCL